MLIAIQCALLAAGLVGAYFAWRNYKIVRLIKETPTTRIDQLRTRMSEVQGHVVSAGSLLRSPMSDRECVHYHFKVEEKRTRHSGKNRSTYWATVINDAQSVTCLVADDSGCAEVPLTEANLVLDPDTRARSGFLDDASPRMEGLLQERYGRSSKGWIFNKTMRYTETILEEGDPLYVLGMVAKTGDAVRIGPDGPIFLASDKGEGAMVSRYFWGTVALALAAVATVAVCLWLAAGLD